LVPAEVLVGHASFDIPLTEPWIELKRREYGRSKIVIAERAETVTETGTADD